MKRSVYFAAILLLLDQVTKALAMRYLQGYQDDPLLLLPGLGLTYAVNYGIWINTALPAAYIPLIQALAGVLVVLGAYFLAFYHRFYRRSRWSELAYACLVAGVLGNIFLDRLLYGYVRDFIFTPIAIANLADVYGNAMLLAILVEFLTFPDAGKLLRLGTPAQWRRETRVFFRFVRLSTLRLWQALRSRLGS